VGVRFKIVLSLRDPEHRNHGGLKNLHVATNQSDGGGGKVEFFQLREGRYSQSPRGEAGGGTSVVGDDRLLWVNGKDQEDYVH